MGAHAVVQDFTRNVVPVLVLEEPVTNLLVPHKAVAAQFDSVLPAEICNLVSVVPIELSLIRLYQLRLHHILRRHAVEVPLYQGNLCGICDIPQINGYTYGKIRLVSFLKRAHLSIGRERGRDQCNNCQ